MEQYRDITISIRKERRLPLTQLQQFLHGSGAFRKRGEMDGLEKLCDYADKLEQATIDTIESGIMTKDLSAITTLSNAQTVTSEEFLSAIRSRLEALLA